MAPDPIYYPLIVQWTENGKTEQRTLKVEKGFSFNFEQSGKKYTPQAAQRAGSANILELKKEDAYNLLGLSHAKEDGYKNKSGQQVYVLDSKDLAKAKEAYDSNIVDNLSNHMVNWSGSGARVVKADMTTNGGMSIIHKANGSSEEYSISVFFNNKK